MNKDGTITICGIDFVFPKDEVPNKWDYKIEKEGKTTTKILWIDTMVQLGTATCTWAYDIRITNRGKCFFDGKHITNKDDMAKIKYVFENIKEA